MNRNDLSNFDASARAGSELETVLRSVTQNLKPEKRITVEEALQQKRVSKKVLKRSAARVLFISQDTTLLNPATQSLDGFVNLKDLFEEVHILILREGIPAKNPALRVEENVWMYTASAKSWVQMPKAGTELIEGQLVFANGFRPDLIVARDPFESALVGKRLSEKYDRPLQVHVLTNYAGEKFRSTAAKNFWRRFIPRFTLPTATSVRADTDEILNVVKRDFKIPDLQLLPKFHAYEELITRKTSLDLKEKYKPFIFFFLYIGPLNHDSTLYRAIDAARFVLKNPRVGMIVLGDGPAKIEFQKRTKILGIEKQVIFESGAVDPVEYLKSADILIAPDTGSEADDIVLKGAASGIALILASNERREDLFETDVSAILCQPDDTQAFTEAASELLNNMGKRNLMVGYAQEMVRSKFHQDSETYRDAYRKSIEQTIFVAKEESKTEE